jgi:hypothetical protein
MRFHPVDAGPLKATRELQRLVSLMLFARLGPLRVGIQRTPFVGPGGSRDPPRRLATVPRCLLEAARPAWSGSLWVRSSLAANSRTLDHGGAPPPIARVPPAPGDSGQPTCWPLRRRTVHPCSPTVTDRTSDGLLRLNPPSRNSWRVGMRLGRSEEACLRADGLIGGPCRLV